MSKTKPIILMDFHDTIVRSGNLMPDILKDIATRENPFSTLPNDDDTPEYAGGKTFRDWLITGDKFKIFRELVPRKEEEDEVYYTTRVNGLVNEFNKTLFGKLGPQHLIGDDVQTALTELSDKAHIVVVSNSPQEFLEQGVEQLGLSKFVSACLGPKECSKGSLKLVSDGKRLSLAERNTQQVEKRDKLYDALPANVRGPKAAFSITAGIGDSQGDMEAFSGVGAKTVVLITTQGYKQEKVDAIRAKVTENGSDFEATATLEAVPFQLSSRQR